MIAICDQSEWNGEAREMREFIVEGTAHGRPVKVRVFAQNHTDAQNRAKEQTGDPHMTFRRTTEV